VSVFGFHLSVELFVSSLPIHSVPSIVIQFTFFVCTQSNNRQNPCLGSSVYVKEMCKIMLYAGHKLNVSRKKKQKKTK
jgi:hypothetical protein